MLTLKDTIKLIIAAIIIMSIVLTVRCVHKRLESNGRQRGQEKRAAIFNTWVKQTDNPKGLTQKEFFVLYRADLIGNK